MRLTRERVRVWAPLGVQVMQSALAKGAVWGNRGAQQRWQRELGLCSMFTGARWWCSAYNVLASSQKVH